MAHSITNTLLFFFRGSGMGADPSRAPCRKAKDLRKERRLQKEQIRQHPEGVSSIVSPTPPIPTQMTQHKGLEDFINQSLSENSTHSLEVSRKQSFLLLC